MNKNAIKKFAIEARRKLIDSVTDKAGMLGITAECCSEPVTKGTDFEVYQTIAGTEVTLNKRQCEQRRKLAAQIHSRGFEAVVEEVAYTWFNRICAIRFMEVNDYLPNRVRVLSSEKEGKMEPDIVTQAPDVDLELTAQEKEEIINWKLSGTSEDTDKLYCKLFLKQCHQLHEILPGLFEADSDYMELLFGISYTNKDDVIYMLVNPDTGIPENDFNVSALDEEGNPTGQVEIIGWLYQYYNTELKDDTFAKLKKNIKITKERIPAATQLFTPDWIVRYMVENSVGRIWIEHLRVLDPTTDEKATAERFGWKYYLPEAEQEESVNVKLAEIRSTYKDLKPTDITCIDPCMGSGHILIAMFDVLMDIYESAGYDKREAAFEIVEHNIHGLDIDKRAYQLAYFSVMMKGRGYNRRFLRGRDGKPEPKVYAIVESNEINRDHLKFFGNSMAVNERKQAVEQMETLLDTFVDAKEYGSIINVDEYNWDVLDKFVEDLDNDGQISFESVGSEETQEQLRKLVKVAQNLGQKYDAVVTNPPYMASSGMSKKLFSYVKKNYDDGRNDLYTVFILKCCDFCKKNGYVGMITQLGWMSLRRSSQLRKVVYLQTTYQNMIHLGSHVFEELSGEVVKSGAFVILKNYFPKYKATFVKLDTVNDKESSFFEGKNLYTASTEETFEIEEAPLSYWLPRTMLTLFSSSTISSRFICRAGMQTGNNEMFLRYWYEPEAQKVDHFVSGTKWFSYNKGGSQRKWYGNTDLVVNWENNGFDIKLFKKHRLELGEIEKKNSECWNSEFYFVEGATWSSITSGTPMFRYTSDASIFDIKGPTCFAQENVTHDELLQVLGYLNSPIVGELLKVLSPTLDCNPGTVSNLPYKPQVNKKSITNLVKLCIEYSKEDWDAYETSWDFKRHPLLPKENISIASCFKQWDETCNNRFYKLKENEEKLNDIFIEIYGLQNELIPEVEDKDVTVRKADLGRDIRSFISYAVGCMFGRYCLDEEGLIYAGGEWDDSKYQFFIPDKDNCIPITDEEYFSDDIVSRFVEFVKTVYGPDTLEENLDFIANALGNKGNTARGVIRNYFLKDFYADHLKVYQKRPIYWLFDSGKQNGFKALIYMHRYNADAVGRVRTDYLHKAQKYVETAMQSAQYTIENASSASEKSKATKAVTKYTKQLAEMKIYDEAIAHVANQRIEIDLDDGVKVNYAKFQGIEVAQEGKKALKVDLLAKLK